MKGLKMKQIIPAQNIEKSNAIFPITGDRCKNYCMIVTMELFGCSISQVVSETGLSDDEINEICNSEDYNYIKQSLINNIRELDKKTLNGKIIQEATDAFNRMVELSVDAKKEDVRLEANKDILDRAMISGTNLNEADELRITFVKRR